MGGVAKTFQKALGKAEESGAIKRVVEPQPVAKVASAAIEEDRAARRRARRGGRALLSEARLTPESGVGGQTLGSGPSV